MLLLDPANFARYRAGQPFEYVGGLRKRSPVRLEVPHDGRWYALLDLGGFGGHVRGAVSVLGPDGSTVPLATDAVVEDQQPAPSAS